MFDISERIERVLSRRRQQLPIVEAEIAWWDRVPELVTGPAAAVESAAGVAIPELAGMDAPAMARTVDESRTALWPAHAHTARKSSPHVKQV